MSLAKRKLVLFYLSFFLAMAISLWLVFHFYLIKRWVWLEVLVALNFSSWMLFGFDKTAAGQKDAQRLPELFFYLIAALGGSIGVVLGMSTFRHKTRKLSFSARVIAILVLQLGVAGYWWWQNAWT